MASFDILLQHGLELLVKSARGQPVDDFSPIEAYKQLKKLVKSSKRQWTKRISTALKSPSM